MSFDFLALLPELWNYKRRTGKSPALCVMWTIAQWSWDGDADLPGQALTVPAATGMGTHRRHEDALLSLLDTGALLLFVLILVADSDY